jgi:hypothetical protein
LSTLLLSSYWVRAFTATVFPKSVREEAVTEVTLLSIRTLLARRIAIFVAARAPPALRVPSTSRLTPATISAPVPPVNAVVPVVHVTVWTPFGPISSKLAFEVTTLLTYPSTSALFPEGCPPVGSSSVTEVATSALSNARTVPSASMKEPLPTPTGMLPRAL